MRKTSLKPFKFILSSALLVAGLNVEINSAIAQSRYRECQPPNAGEYLLFVVSKTSQNQELVRNTVPANTNAIVCNYLEDVVTRISGFSSVEDATDWVRYMNDIAGLPAFIVQAQTVVEVADTTSSDETPAYNPQYLGTGYAVLVDYFNQPEIATQVQRLLGKEVGLVSYGQRPYLLVLQTTNQRNADNTFNLLNDRGFFAILVDSQKVALLRPRVRSAF